MGLWVLTGQPGGCGGRGPRGTKAKRGWCCGFGTKGAKGKSRRVFKKNGKFGFSL